ncbi:MAG: hypothetical protein RLO50_01515 [Azospirillaceae bacterium]
MTRLRVTQTSFAAGEIDATLAGRGDLGAYQAGARRLTNMVIDPRGGVYRRPGLAFVADLPDRPRLFGAALGGTTDVLLAIRAGAVDIFEAGVKTAEVAAPWSAAQVPGLSLAQTADAVIVTHGAVAPHLLTRDAGAWSLAPWTPAATGEARHLPFHRFVADGVQITLSGTHPAIRLSASQPVFEPGHAGVHLFFAEQQVRIETVVSPTQVDVTVLGSPYPISKTKIWFEEAWSAVRGWPEIVTFHQNRMVIGGSAALPNRLWMSRIGDHFNFDLGAGLDDEAIEFPVLADRADRIRGLVSGPDLQVFTSGAEWVVTGTPMTPATVQLFRQTQVGSPADRLVPPVAVDGATLFAAASGDQLRDFTFDQAAQAYQARDLSLLAPHLIATPVDMAYDRRRRLLIVAMADGPAALLTLYRSEGVAGWSRLTAPAPLGAVAAAGDDVFAAYPWNGGWRLARFDPDIALDAAVTVSAGEPATVHAGFDAHSGTTVRVVAGGQDQGDRPVDAGGAVTLDAPAATVTAGHAFTHEVEPLAPLAVGQGWSQGVALRPVETVLRLYRTGAIRVDTGAGLQALPLPGADPLFDGDVRFRHGGWRRSATTPLWRVAQDDPAPFMLLLATTEMKVND